MKKLITYLFISLVATSCSNEFTDTPFETTEEHPGITLQQRNPKLPDTWSRRRQFSQSRGDFGIIPVEKYMGRSYRIGNTIMGDIVNVGPPVINIEQLQQKHPTYITSDYIRTSHLAFTSYSSYERYEEQSTVTRKVSSGFNLNLKLFKIGRQKAQQRNFTTISKAPKEALLEKRKLKSDTKNMNYKQFPALVNEWRLISCTKSF